MAYGRGNNVSSNNNRTVGGSSAGQKKTEAIFSTGLFAPREGSKSVATIQLKESVTIPAGAYINLYSVDQKTEKSPIFRMQVRPGQLKSKA